MRCLIATTLAALRGTVALVFLQQRIVKGRDRPVRPAAPLVYPATHIAIYSEWRGTRASLADVAVEEIE